jgi:hypothetical protein
MLPAPRPASPALLFHFDRGVVIRATAYVVPAWRDNDGPPYYEIIAGPDLDPDGPQRVFLTRDEDLYTLAAALEGTERRVTLTWAPVLHARTRRTVRVLEAIRP